MQLATDATDFASGALGLVELGLSFINDRQKRMFAKAEMVEYVNQAQLKIASMINGYHREYFLTYATSPTTANQTYYALPADLVHFWGLEYRDSASDRDHQKLVEIPFHDKDFYERLALANNKAELGFFFIAGTTFKLGPEIATTGGELRLHYVKRLAPLTANAHVSEIPVEHHELLAIDAARRCYVKLNRNNQQLERMWTEGVGVLEKAIRWYSINRERRTRPFYGSYGPIPNLLDKQTL